MKTQTQPLTLSDKLLASRCALVVVDMQNDFCAPGGYVERVIGKEAGAAQRIVPALERLLGAARGAAVPVIWLRADYSASAIPASMSAKLAERGIAEECCKPGSWGADWFGVQPLPTEEVVTKHTYSGFHGTRLERLLRLRAVESLVVTGVQTQICVESTVRDAHSRGFLCVVPADAVASHTPPLHDASLQNIRFLFGEVCGADDVLRAWQPQPASNS